MKAKAEMPSHLRGYRAGRSADRYDATRDHYVAGEPPAWSRLAHRFTRFDRSRVDQTPGDWRHGRQGGGRRPPWRARVRAWLLRAGRWALRQIHPDPRERRAIYVYLLLATWMVMIAIGILAHEGIHP